MRIGNTTEKLLGHGHGHDHGHDRLLHPAGDSFVAQKAKPLACSRLELVGRIVGNATRETDFGWRKADEKAGPKLRSRRIRTKR
jgi:hypothetical protein